MGRGNKLKRVGLKIKGSEDKNPFFCFPKKQKQLLNKMKKAENVNCALL